MHDKELNDKTERTALCVFILHVIISVNVTLDTVEFTLHKNNENILKLFTVTRTQTLFQYKTPKGL